MHTSKDSSSQVFPSLTFKMHYLLKKILKLWILCIDHIYIDRYWKYLRGRASYHVMSEGLKCYVFYVSIKNPIKLLLPSIFFLHSETLNLAVTCSASKWIIETLFIKNLEVCHLGKAVFLSCTLFLQVFTLLFFYYQNFI